MPASAATASCTIRLPRVALVPGLGLFGMGRSEKEARVAADLAEAAVAAITDAEATGTFESISEADMFDCEYWPLELAKLGSAKPLPLAGQIAVITGAGGAIGAATAPAFAKAGAEVALLDLDVAAAAKQAKAIGGAALAVALRRDRRGIGARRRSSGVVDAFRRRRYLGFERRRGLAGQDRRGRRSGAARELRTELLRPPEGRAGRR